jgi:hypothetical protein
LFHKTFNRQEGEEIYTSDKQILKRKFKHSNNFLLPDYHHSKLALEFH